MTTEIKNESACITIYSDSFNKRIRIDEYSGNVSEVIKLIVQATEPWVEKIIVKARKGELDVLQSAGFHQEAFIKGYFKGADMHFMTRYFSEGRTKNVNHPNELKIIDSLLKEERAVAPIECTEVALATEKDAAELTELYATVFQVYPTPIGEPGYVLKTMREGTVYVVIRENNKIVSAASAEIAEKFSNAELTDCATLPQAQGKGHMKKLLLKLEEVLTSRGIHCLYTIARAESYSMNKAFYQLRYTFGGLMTNNCYIYSGLEDMNVWYKLV